MEQTELSDYIAELRKEVEKLPRVHQRGELLERAFEIPLIWPESEYLPDRSKAEQFKAALAPWNGEVHPVADESHVVPKVAEIVRAAEAKRLSRWQCPRLDRFDWEKGLADLGVEWVLPSPEEVAAANSEERKAIRERLAGIDLGITDADYAVAHTGTLVCEHTAQRNGFTNLFPWTHVSIVWMSQMVGTLEELFTRFELDHKEKPWRPNTILNTGPSRSGDIDLTQGQGAAGPGSWHVVLIDDER